MGCPFLISKDPKPPISYCRILPLNPKPIKLVITRKGTIMETMDSDVFLGLLAQSDLGSKRCRPDDEGVDRVPAFPGSFASPWRDRELGVIQL